MPALPSWWRMLAAVLVLRCLLAGVMQTSFVPDEWYQAGEVAYRLAYDPLCPCGLNNTCVLPFNTEAHAQGAGTCIDPAANAAVERSRYSSSSAASCHHHCLGHVTWEWRHGLRGALHPYLLAALFGLLKWLSLDSAWMLNTLPGLFQAVLATVSDLYIYLLAAKLLSADAKRKSKSISQLLLPHTAIAVSLLCWYATYTFSRTLTTTLEGLLTPTAVFYWPILPSDWQSSDRAITSKLWIGAPIAAITCLLRPTAAIFWAFLYLSLPFVPTLAPASSSWHLRRLARITFTVLIPTAMLTLVVSLAVDFFFYGRFVLPPLDFVKFNLTTAQSSFYGTHPWHWYLTQGLPTVLGVFILVLPSAVRILARAGCFPIVIACIGSIAVYSLSPHKEFRFLGAPLYALLPGIAAALSSRIIWPLRLPRKVFWMTSAAVHIPLLLFVCFVHQRGGVAIMADVRQHIDILTAQGTDHPAILFLTPCHATPFYAYLHRPHARLDFPECPPPGMGDNERQLFFDQPVEWLEQRFHHPTRPRAFHHLPDAIVAFTNVVPRLESWNHWPDYEHHITRFHTLFPDSEQDGTHLALFIRRRSLKLAEV